MSADVSRRIVFDHLSLENLMKVDHVCILVSCPSGITSVRRKGGLSYGSPLVGLSGVLMWGRCEERAHMSMHKHEHAQARACKSMSMHKHEHAQA